MKISPQTPNPTTAYTVKSLVKALTILQVLADEDPPYTLTQLSRRLRLHVTTVHRLMVNLVRNGFVEEDPASGGYQLSTKVLRMGLRVLDRLDFRAVAQPLLRDLNQATQETVHLAILQGTQAISIDKFDTPHPVGLDARLGGIMPLHCTGVGKTLLAHQSDEFLAGIAKSPGFPRMTERTITALPKMREELRAIRERGFTVDQEEAVEGLSCVASPIFNHTGQIVAAFSVAGPATRLTSARISAYAQLVLTTSREISYRLGYRPKDSAPLTPPAHPTKPTRPRPRQSKSDPGQTGMNKPR